VANFRGSSFRRNFVGSRQKRKVSWNVGPGGTTLTQVVASGSVIVGAIVNTIVDGITCVRLRGQLTFYLSAATAADDGFSGAFGIAKVRAAAAAVGITAVPTPITDVADEWLYHRFFHIHAPAAFAATGYASDSVAASMQIDVDSKAMRKMTQGDSLVAVVEVVERGTAQLAIWFDSRTLVKLS